MPNSDNDGAPHNGVHVYGGQRAFLTDAAARLRIGPNRTILNGFFARNNFVPFRPILYRSAFLIFHTYESFMSGRRRFFRTRNHFCAKNILRRFQVDLIEFHSMFEHMGKLYWTIQNPNLKRSSTPTNGTRLTACTNPWGVY